MAEDTEIFFLALLDCMKRTRYCHSVMGLTTAMHADLLLTVKSKSGSTSESGIASAVCSLVGSVDVRHGAAFNASSLPVGSCFTCPAKSGSGKGVNGRFFFRERFSRVRRKSRSSTRDDATLYWSLKELGDLSARECKRGRRACPVGVDS